MSKIIKGIIKSKTMWLSSIIAFLSLVLEHLPILKVYLADNYQASLFSLSLIVGLLRFVTNKSIEEKGE